MALGGLATTNKGITTPEGLTMAKKKFQLDDKDADTNGDGELSTREKEIGKAVQRNVDTEITDDEKVQMSHAKRPVVIKKVQNCAEFPRKIAVWGAACANPVKHSIM